MSERFHTIGTTGVRLTLDLDVGHIRSFAVQYEGQTVTPLHTAPWVDDPTIAADPSIPPNLNAFPATSFARLSARAMSRMRRRTAGPPIRAGTSSAWNGEERP